MQPMTKAQKAAAKILAKKGLKAEADAAVSAATPVQAASAAASADAKPLAESDRHVTGVLASRPASKDVKISSFCMSAFGRELILDTTLELSYGARYGLLGSNGSGKSQFLQSLANREVPIPGHIDIFLLDHEAEPSERTAVQCVIDDAQAEVKRLEAEAERVLEEQGPESEVLEAIYIRLDSLNPAQFEASACKILHGLGFDRVMMEKKTKDLSGGWRMRVALSKALFIKPSLLLLDEPTNHLDLGACVWLEEYLSTYDRTLVVISHSQDFLNGVCTHVMHLDQKRKLTYYTGNYDQFIQTKAELEVNQMKLYKKEQEDIAHIKDFVASCGTYSNLVRQAKSKMKIIEKMEEKGLTEKVEEEHKYVFRFPTCDALPTPVVAFNDVAFAYSGLMQDLLYKDVNIGLSSDSRVAIVGPNGAGKSTLLKLMLNDLTPTRGEVRRHSALSIGRYHQHSAEIFPADMDPLEYFRKLDPSKEETEWRTFMGKFGISGYLQTTQFSKLSDGQKSRLVFAQMAVSKPNMLLLDEPTNHLDMQSIDALADALNNFSGGVVLVSHDFRLINQVAKEVWVVDENKVSTWKGDIRSYKKKLTKQMHAAEEAMLKSMANMK